MSRDRRAALPYLALFERAARAASDVERAEILAEIETGLRATTAPGERGRLLMCRARVHSNQWRTAQVFEDTRAAMALFEQGNEADQAADAASWAAAHASRMGELSVASELATRSLLALESIRDDRIRLEIHNRLGIFCVSFIDYDRAIEQFEASLAAAERIGDRTRTSRQLANISDTLLLAHRQRQLAHAPTHGDELDRAERVVARLFEQATDEFIRRAGSYRLLAEIECERGRPGEALAILDRYRDAASSVAAMAQRAALAWIEARALRQVGRAVESVKAAELGVSLARNSDDDHEKMLALEELASCQEAAGDLAGAVATARDVKAMMWTIHQRQTRQLVREVWARADMVRDHATLASQAAEASRRAEEDELTGIGNRRTFERFLASEARELRDVALIIVDVDHFKDINDTFGHVVGDAVLRRVSHLLRDEMRPHQVAVRYGGDEFVLALLDVDLAAAARFAERLRRRIAELDWNVTAPGLRVTSSQGVAAGNRRRWRAVLAAADEALYAAKRGGRNAVVAAPELLRAS